MRSLLIIGLTAAAVFTIACSSQQTAAPQSAHAAAPADSPQAKFTSTAPAPLTRPNPVTSKACSADKINDSDSPAPLKVAKSAKLVISGWAVDDVAGTAPPEIYVELIPASGATKYYARAARLTKRPDVAQAHKNPAFENSGYDLEGDLADVRPGAYAVHVAQSVAAGAIVCDTRRKIEVQ